jgi:glycosyltransferase involved in cell wall biosynthesis
MLKENNKMNKIGIIVPVYNIRDDLLVRCVNSISSQTYEDLEIIIVDDGSMGKCAKKCDELAACDNRIKVIHKANGGLAQARNIGEEQVDADWLMFVDADDWLDIDICERISKYFNSSIDIIIFGGYRNIGEKCSKIPMAYYREKTYVDEECKELRRLTLNHDSFISSVWGKIYRTQFLRENLLFHDKELRSGMEGIEFLYRVFDKTKKVLTVQEYGYHYYFNSESLSAKPSESSNNLTILGLNKIKDYICENNIDEMESLYIRTIYVLMAISTRTFFNPGNRYKYRERVNGVENLKSISIIKETLEQIRISDLPVQKRVLLLMIKRKLYLLLYIYSILSYYTKK